MSNSRGCGLKCGVGLHFLFQRLAEMRCTRGVMPVLRSSQLNAGETRSKVADPLVEVGNEANRHDSLDRRLIPRAARQQDIKAPRHQTKRF